MDMPGSQRPRRSARSSAVASPAPAAPTPSSRLSAVSNVVATPGPSSNSPASSSWPLGKTAAPIPPYTPIGSGQARFTSYTSRMRAGTTGLMQPFAVGTGPGEGEGANSRGADYGTTERTKSGSTRRRAAAGMTYYGEDSGDDFGEEDSDGESVAAGAKRKGTPLQRGGKSKEMPSARESPAEDEDAGKSYLGLPPPGNKVMVRRAQKTPHQYFSDYDMVKAADHREVLVPIRLELETETHRIRDVFTWNMNEKLMQPAQFAKIFLQDLDLPLEPYAAQIEASITQQLADATGVADVEIGPAAGGLWASRDPPPGLGRAALPPEEREKDARSWDWGLERRDWTGKRKAEAPLESGVELGEVEDDLRVIVDLDVQILRHHLRDRLEWDLCSPLTPENFARTIRSDLGLSGESDPLIANAVREQLLHHKRAALELGLVGSGAVFEHAVEELRIADEEESLLAAGKSLPPEREEAVTSSEPRAAEVLEGGSSPAPPNPDLDPTSGFSTPGGPAASAASAPLPRPTPTARRSAAISVLRDLSSRGPRPLEGVWRDWGESREFGPLLEVMTAEELERLEEANVRASRRNRRETQRAQGNLPRFRHSGRR